MGKDSGASNAADQAAIAQTRLAQQLVGEVTPLRQDLIGQAGEFVGGDRDVTGLPEFRSAKSASEAQFNRARDNIIGSTPTGGGLTAALAGLEGDRASNQVAFTGDIAGSALAQAGVGLADPVLPHAGGRGTTRFPDPLPALLDSAADHLSLQHLGDRQWRPAGRLAGRCRRSR